MSGFGTDTGRARRPPSRVILVLAVAVASSGALLLRLQSRLTFFADEWQFLLDRRGSSVGVFLDPHNDHIALAPVSIYKALLATFGMSSAAPFQVASTALFLLSTILLFVLLRSRVGDWAALLGTILVLFLGAAWVDLLWPFQIAFFGSMAAGLGALLALDRDDRAGDRVACLLLVASTAFLEMGIAFAVAALVNVALGRRPRGRRLYVGLVPIALYAVWYAGWGHQSTSRVTFHNLLHSPGYVFDIASQAIAALLGLATPLTGDGHNLVGLPWGRALLVVAIVLSIWRLRRVGGPSRGLWTALALGLTFWFLASLNAYSFLREPSDGRYVYPGAVFVLLIAAELLRGVRLGKRLSGRRDRSRRSGGGQRDPLPSRRISTATARQPDHASKARCARDRQAERPTRLGGQSRCGHQDRRRRVFLRCRRLWIPGLVRVRARLERRGGTPVRRSAARKRLRASAATGHEERSGKPNVPERVEVADRKPTAAPAAGDVHPDQPD